MGDAPSPYFLAQMHAKQALEAIRCLTREDGSLVDYEDGIMTDIGDAYAEIYTKDEQVELHAAERQQVLSLIDWILAAEERATLDRLLDAAEIEEVVMWLPGKKVPGLDGLTAEVLRKCWEWIQDGGYTRLLEQWHTYTWNNQRGYLLNP